MKNYVIQVQELEEKKNALASIKKVMEVSVTSEIFDEVRQLLKDRGVLTDEDLSNFEKILVKETG